MSNKRTHRTRIGTSDSSRRFLQASRCRAGELYLFRRTERAYSASGSLFGIFDKEVSGVIYMESSSSDLCHFRMRHRLPRGYRCSRRATRSELRDYIFNLACYEYLHMGINRSCRTRIRKTKCCTHKKRSAQKRKTKRIRGIPLLIQSPRPENETVTTLF